MFSRLFRAANKKLPALSLQIRRQMAKTVDWYEYHFIKPEDISVVQKTWLEINNDPNATCKLIFKNMFTKMPKAESWYRRYKDSPTTSIVDSEKFERPCLRLVGNMSEMIENLDDQDATLRILKRMADSHKGIVTAEFFITLIDVMVETLRELGGDGFTVDVERKWRKILFATMTTVDDFLQ